MSQYPALRLRRLRTNDWSRRLVRETNITPADLIYPVFVQEGNNYSSPIPSMPGIHRLSIDLLLKEAETLLTLKIPAIALFPVIPSNMKNHTAEEAYNPSGLIPTAIRALKKHFPELGLIADV